MASFEEKAEEAQPSYGSATMKNVDLRRLRNAVNGVLDHIVEDLGIEQVAVEQQHDFYWLPALQRYDCSKSPAELDVGRLSDDADFIELIRRGESADVAYNLVHIAPLLEYIAEKIKA